MCRKASIVALLGGNGAGKTTTLRAVSNLLHGERGEVTKGSIELKGERVEALTPGRSGQARCDPGHGRAPLFRPPDHRGKPDDRRLHADRRQGCRRGDAGEGLQLLSAPQDAAYQPGRLHLRRRAADVRHRSRADGQSEDGPARRAVDGPGAADRRGGVRHRQGSQPARESDLPAGRAEHQRRPALSPTSATSSKTAASSWRDRPRICATTRTSRSSTSACLRRGASRSRTSSTTAAASAGSREVAVRRPWRRCRAACLQPANGAALRLALTATLRPLGGLATVAVNRKKTEKMNELLRSARNPRPRRARGRPDGQAGAPGGACQGDDVLLFLALAGVNPFECVSRARRWRGCR